MLQATGQKGLLPLDIHRDSTGRDSSVDDNCNGVDLSDAYMRTVSVCDDNRIMSQLPSEIQAQLGELIEVAFQSDQSRREFLFSHGTVSYTLGTSCIDVLIH